MADMQIKVLFLLNHKYENAIRQLDDVYNNYQCKEVINSILH